MLQLRVIRFQLFIPTKKYTKKIKGTFIQGKLFTDDPDDKGNKGYAAGTIKSVRAF